MAAGRPDVSPCSRPPTACPLDCNRTLTDDVEWWIAGPSEILPWAGTRRGREQVGRFLVAFPETLEIQAFEPRTFIAQGETVVVLGRELARVKPTGCICETEWVMVFTLRDGKIARFRQYHDSAAWVVAYRGPA